MRQNMTRLGSLAVVPALLAAPLVAGAQQAARVPRIGWLGGPTRESAEPYVQAFQQGLRDLGWVEGQNIIIEWRYAGGRAERLPALAAELVRLFGRATTQGAIELAKKKGLQVVLVDAYPEGNTDFSVILTKVRAANPDVLGGTTRFDDAVAITRQMKALNVNPRMVGLTVGVDSPKFHEIVGRDAEFVYGATSWMPELVEVRAGGLIPIARQYPGAREFVESHTKEFPGADLSYFSAAGYGGCQILVEAIKRAGSLDSEKLREAILQMDHNTVFGRFRVDRDGFQIAHKWVMFQWQDGKKVIVWPEELAPGKARFPTPPWSQRR